MASRTVDMSPAAVSRRLEELAQLYEMALSLKRARVIGPLRSAVEQAAPPVAASGGPTDG